MNQYMELHPVGMIIVLIGVIIGIIGIIVEYPRKKEDSHYEDQIG